MQWNVAKRPKLASHARSTDPLLIVYSRFVAINAAFPRVGYDNIIKLLAGFGARFEREGDCFYFRDFSVLNCVVEVHIYVQKNDSYDM